MPSNSPCLMMIVLAAALAAGAHDIPNDVTVQAFLKPEGQRLRLLVRAPMKAMRDVEFPQKGPGYLDLARTGPFLADAATLWICRCRLLFTKATSRSAETAGRGDHDLTRIGPVVCAYEDALAHVTGAGLPLDTNVVWNQTMLDVLFEYPIQSERSEFAIHPGLDRLGVRTVTALRFLVPQGGGNYVVRAFEFDNDPGIVKLDPRWYQASLRFVREGFLHILDGTDHLLFLLCLVIPFRRFRGLIPVVTAFTVAHSITLIASAYNLGPDALWFPPLIETLIAASIVYMALENIVTTSTVRQRWMIAFGFGLVHGFGFSFALKQTLQFAGDHLLTSLLSFNIGVELGQLLVLAVLVPALELLFRYVVAERMGTIILSALVAHTAWHWMTERFDRLRQFRFEWPEINAAFLAGALRWLMLLVIVAALWWLGSGVLRRFVTGSRPAGENE